MVEDPRGRHLLPREIAALAYSAGWIDAQKLLEAVSIAIAESNGYEKRRGPVHADGTVGNPDGSVDRGLWAINSKAHSDVPDSVCDNAKLATAYARKLYLSNGWQPWASYANGQYHGERAMGYAFDAISNMLRVKNGYPV